MKFIAGPCVIESGVVHVAGGVRLAAINRRLGSDILINACVEHGKRQGLG